MNVTKRFSIRASAACGVLTISALSAVAAPLLFGTDYETIPPQHAVVHSQLHSLSINLSDCITAAEKVTNGIATSAQVNKDATPPTANIIVYADAAKFDVTVNAKTGEIITQREIPRFPGDATEGEWTITDSGLKYWDIKVGEGAMPASPSSKVTVHYTGWLTDGTKFDSSVDRGQPATFPLRGVIPGWTEGVGSMRIGGKRKLVIPYNLAYGEHGRSSIPPKATLIFDVELLEVQDQ